MQPKNLHLLFCALLLSTGMLKAQNTFTLQQAINYAFEHQASAQNALLDEQISKKKVDEITGMGTPQISGSAEINDFLEIPTSFVPAEFFGGDPGTYAPVKFGTQYTSAVGASVSQLLFDGSYLVGLQASYTYRELSRKQTHQTKTEVAVNVSKAYYGYLVMDNQLSLIDASIARIGKTLHDTRALYENGFAEKIDADRLELALNNLKVQQDRIQRMKALSYSLLKFQMGMPPTESPVLSDKIEDFALDLQVLPDSADITKRPDFEVLTVQHRLQELDLKRYKTAYLPSLVAFGSLSANASRTEFNIFDTKERWYPTSIIGLKLTMNIWDGMQRESKISQARLNLQKIDNAITQAKQGFQVDYLNAKSNYETNRASLETVSRNRDLAKEILRTAKAKYDNGVGSGLELTDAESAVKEADANYFNTLYETILSKIDLDKASGTLKY